MNARIFQRRTELKKPRCRNLPSVSENQSNSHQVTG